MYVYCRIGEFLVILQKTKDTITNEDRLEIPEPKSEHKFHGIHCANMLFVKNFVNLLEISKPIPYILISPSKKVEGEKMEHPIVFKLGEMVIDETFDYMTNRGKIKYYICEEDAVLSGDNNLLIRNYTGYLRRYNPEGVLTISFDMVGGKIDGYLREYFPNGRIYICMEYSQGLPHGKSYVYNKLTSLPSIERVYEKGEFVSEKLL
jgi:antitoxin component YwqK of YwqJK toxin-antitoxin module